MKQELRVAAALAVTDRWTWDATRVWSNMQSLVESKTNNVEE